jgi:hypothetical protein
MAVVDLKRGDSIEWQFEHRFRESDCQTEVNGAAKATDGSPVEALIVRAHARRQARRAVAPRYHDRRSVGARSPSRRRFARHP